MTSSRVLFFYSIYAVCNFDSYQYFVKYAFQKIE